MYNYIHIAPCIPNLAISCIVYYTYRQYKIRIIRITYCDTLFTRLPPQEKLFLCPPFFKYISTRP